MTLESLNAIFKPSSVAVVGADEEPGSPGQVVMKNLTEGKFIGPILPMHDELDRVMDLPVYREVDTLPLTPDLAVICCEPSRIPDYILHFGRRGTGGALILSRGLDELDSETRLMLENAILSAAQKNRMRVLGPGSSGYINPHVGINASLAHMDAMPGNIGFISQSASLFTSVLDWAKQRNIGFSHCISLGGKLDLDFSTLLDFLSGDPKTRTVMLYLEDIKDSRSFMSAARSLARNKPVLVIKSGRTEEAERLMMLTADTPPGTDAVYDAAFRRAGMLRVFDIDSLFDAVETITRSRPLKGERLAVLVNGRSPGYLVTDMLLEGGGVMAKLSEDAKEELSPYARKPAGNPVIIPADSPPEHYAEVLRLLVKAKGVDAVLVMHVPSAVVDGAETAGAVAEIGAKAKRTVLASWIGGENATRAREIFNEAGVSSYWTPDKAARSFLHLVHYRRNQEMLMETPASLPSNFEPDTSAARRVVSNALDAGRELLTVPETMEVLAAYEIPALDTRLASTPDDAAEAGAEIGFPVALKILSPDIVRKTQAGGVTLDLESADDVREAAENVKQRVLSHHPDAHVAGYIVQEMGRRATAVELFMSAGTDPAFGPYIRFGHGGADADEIADNAVALPPLNMSLARELISRTRVYRRLKGHVEGRSDEIDAICLTLVKISQLVIDVPEIHTLLINPLYGDEEGVLALDAQILVEKTKFEGADRLAIRPYPQELEECVKLKDDRRVLLRPIRPEDEPEHWEFLSKVDAEDLRFRFFGYVSQLPRSEMIRLTQIDYNREMAFIATTEDCTDEQPETLGVVRATTDPDNETAEFAVLVRSDMKGLGLGRLLMEKLIRYFRARGTHYLVGEALMQNRAMAGLAEAVGFDVKKDHNEEMYKFRMVLNPE
jgi:acetyltransferase